jgi:hypothetical protein
MPQNTWQKRQKVFLVSTAWFIVVVSRASRVAGTVAKPPGKNNQS